MLTWLPHWRDPFYGAKAARLQRRLASAGGRPLLVAALGSSRTDRGLQGGPAGEAVSRALGRPVLVFNLGIPGGGPVRELLTLRRVLADAGRPDLVLVEVLPPLLRDDPCPAEANEERLPAGGLRLAELPAVERYSGGARAGLAGQ